MLRRFEVARHLLTMLVREKGNAVAARRAWEPVSYEPYDTLGEMLEGWGSPGPFRISALHSDRTIYATPEANCLFRLWHDSLHVAHKLDMTLAEEIAIARMHYAAVRDFTANRDARLLMWLDTAGQSLHCDKHGSFPEDQLSWAYAQFLKTA